MKGSHLVGPIRVRASAVAAPALRVVKELGGQVRMVRENFTAGLMAYTESIGKAMPDALTRPS